MKAKTIELKEQNRINYDVLDSNEIKFLERNKVVLEMLKKDPSFYKKWLLSKDSFNPNSNPTSDIGTYDLVRSRYNNALPSNYTHIPTTSPLNFPISSSRADRMGNFHLGLGIGQYINSRYKGPNFGNGEASEFNRHTVSAKISHSFPINSFLSTNRNYTIKSSITVPLGGLQFDINNLDIDKTISYFDDTFFSGYLIGNIKMKILVNNRLVKTVKKTFLQWYKTLHEDLGFKIDFLNELETNMNLENNSNLEVEVEVEIIAANTMHLPNGSTPNFPGVYIGVQYFNPDFVLREEFDNVRYIFNEFGETTNFNTSSIKLDYIEVIDTELSTKINPVYTKEEMLSA